MSKLLKLFAFWVVLVVGAAHAQTAPDFNVQTIWWNDPDESEPGWGLNLAHQGNILFASWFTYDTDGTPMWLYMSSAAKTAANRYEGDIYRSTGAPYNAYTPAAFTQSVVGRGVLAFSDAQHGTFSYTVNSTTQSKSIKRYVFAPTVPTCTQGGTYGTPPNYSDLWRGRTVESENGWGLNIVHQGDVLFLSWFTYASNGRGQWLYATIQRNGETTYFGTLQRNSRGPPFNSPAWSRSQLVIEAVGSVTLSFSDASNAVFTYTLDDATQSKLITRNVFQPAVTVCR
jgi:hypothetical protein